MNNNLGLRIRTIRKKLGLTMNEFGQKFSPPASKGVVSNWENGYNNPNNIRLQKIAELGNVSVEFLLTGKQKDAADFQFTSDVIANEYLLQELKKFVNNEKKFSPESLQLIFEAIAFSDLLNNSELETFEKRNTIQFATSILRTIYSILSDDKPRSFTQEKLNSIINELTN